MLTVENIQQLLSAKIPANLVVPEHTIDAHYYRHTVTNQLLASVTTKCGILDSPHLKKWAANLAVEHIDKNWDIITPQNKADIFKAAVLAHEDQFHDAGDVGTQGHGIVEEYLKEWMATGVRPADIRTFIKGTDVRLFAITRSAEMFCRDFDAVPIASELFVCSLRHRFAGTLDSLMLISRVIEKGKTPGCQHDYWSVPEKLYHERCMKCDQKIVKEFALVDWKTSNDIDKVEYAMQVSAYWYALWEMTGLKPKHIIIVRLDKKYAKYEVMRVVNKVTAFRAFKNAAKVWEWLNDGEEKLSPLRPRLINTLNYGDIDKGTTAISEAVRGNQAADSSAGGGAGRAEADGAGTHS